MHKCKASSFADPKDLEKFKECKAQGHSDKICFKTGDNGIGCWGDMTATLDEDMCALPPDDMILRWGSKRAAKHKQVLVRANSRSANCKLADVMRPKRSIPEGSAQIDLNPGASATLWLLPPFLVPAAWQWADDV